MELHNTADVDVERVFYEIAVEFREHGLAERVHCVFAEATPVALDGPMTALELKGASGRLLGLQLGAVIDPRYGELWWGEGEVRIALGDDPAPTLSGTGIEDWAGTGWGMGEFSDPFQGCPIAGTDGQWTPYRLHVEDRVWFDGGIRVTVDAIGGGPADHVLALLASGAPGVPITIDRDGHPLRRLLDEPLAPGEDTSDGWMNFRRSDSYAATTWFALDTPAHAGM
nr:DUF2961 domain-containing protein [Frondihabitans sucicola]